MGLFGMVGFGLGEVMCFDKSIGLFVIQMVWSDSIIGVCA